MSSATLDARALLDVIERAASLAAQVDHPEEAIRVLLAAPLEVIGDREAYLRPGSLKEGERHFFVGGCFITTPDTRYHMLIGNTGFPPEQRRLMVPIEGGHPGTVFRSRAPILLANTDEHGSFKQYLKSSRMGSSIYAPMIWRSQFMGLLIFAAQARHTMRELDLAVLRVLAQHATSLWVAHGGPQWLAAEYPPKDGFYVETGGLNPR